MKKPLFPLVALLAILPMFTIAQVRSSTNPSGPQIAPGTNATTTDSTRTTGTQITPGPANLSAQLGQPPQREWYWLAELPIDTVQEIYSAQPGSAIVKIPVAIVFASDTAGSTAFQLDVSSRNVNAGNGDYRLLTTTIAIPKSSIKPGDTIKVYAFAEIISDDKDESSELFDVIVTPATPGYAKSNKVDRYAVLILNGPKPFDADSPFRVSLGANFDFVDKVQANSLFAHVRFFHPALFGEKKHRFGLYTGVIQNKYISDQSTTTHRIYTPLQSVGPDSSQFLLEEFDLTRTVTYNNLNIYWSPTFRYLINKTATHEYFLFCNIEMEAVHRKIGYQFEYGDLLGTDTVIGPNYFSFLSSKFQPFTNTVVDYYIGAGPLSIYFKNEKGELFVKGSCGMHWQTGDKLNTYYLVQFNLLERKVGVNFGGEIRGEFKSKSSYVGLYLSKAFDVNKLVDF